MKIESCAVIGAGAVGAYFVDGLAEKLQGHLYVIAEGSRKQKLETIGITVNGRQILPSVRTPEQVKGPDLVIVAVKYGALREIQPELKTICDEHTIVLCPMNGIDSEEIIGAEIGMEHVVYSFIKIASHRNGQNIVYDPVTTPGVFFGETDGTYSERIAAMEELFQGSGVHYVISEHILQDQWYKYVLNISRNLPQAILNVGVGAYTDSEHVACISQKMREEVVAVAAAKGIDISDASNKTTKNVPVNPDARFSTLQDLDAGRPTEIDMFSGTLVKMGKELGVPTPFNEFAYHAIKALEEKNAGRIR